MRKFQNPTSRLQAQNNIPRSQAYEVLKAPSTSIPTYTPGPGVNEVNSSDMIIAVMGPTGAGKSTFINIATERKEASVGHDLLSCTREVTAIRCRHPDNTRDVVFVDTPGFDDTLIDDTKILQSIAVWLEQTYRRDIILSGLLFLHRISDNRMSGTSLKNLDMFQKLCGEEGLQNVIVVTTMWGEVTEATGSQREKELVSEYWQGMIECGSQMRRFHDRHASAWEIIKSLKEVQQPLQIQVEIVNKGLNLPETSAGRTVFTWLDDFIKKIKATIHQLEQQLRSSAKHPELTQETQRELVNSERKLAIATVQRGQWRALGMRPRASQMFKSLLGRRRGTVQPQAKYGPGCLGGQIPPTISESVDEVSLNSAVEYESSSPLTIYPPRLFPEDVQRQRQLTTFIVPPPQVASPQHSLPQTTTSNDKYVMVVARGQIIKDDLKRLKGAQEGIKYIPFYYLHSAIVLALSILETINTIQPEITDPMLLTVAHNAGLFLTAITDQVVARPISDEMKEVMDSVVRELQGMHALLAQIQSTELDLRNERGYFYEQRIVGFLHTSVKAACEVFGQPPNINYQDIFRIGSTLSALEAIQPPKTEPEIPKVISKRLTN